MPLSICAWILSGLTMGPQSTAQTTRWTLTLPSLETETSATCATKLPNDSCTARPRPCPSGSGLPQPALSAASSRTPLWRGCLPSSARRNSRRVLARRVRQLVDKALDDERGVRMSDRAPPQGGDAVRGSLPVHQQIGNVVGQLGGPFDGGVVDAIFDDRGLERRARDERLTDDALLPGHGIARRIQTAADRVIGRGSVVPAARVVLARPDDLDRRLDGLRDLHRLAHEVAVEDGAPAEAAAEQRGVDLTCSGLSPATLRRGARSTVWNCVPVQTSQLSGRTSATQLSGSIGAWAR